MSPENSIFILGLYFCKLALEYFPLLEYLFRTLHSKVNPKDAVEIKIVVNDNEKILKKTHWFLMITQSNNSLTPQIKEGIPK